MRYRSKQGISPIPAVIVLTLLIGTTYAWYIIHDAVTRANKQLSDLKLDKASSSEKVTRILTEIDELKRQSDTLQNLCGVGFQKDETQTPMESLLAWIERVNTSREGTPIYPKVPTLETIYELRADANIQSYILYFKDRIKKEEEDQKKQREDLEQKIKEVTTERTGKQESLKLQKARVEQLLQDKAAAEKLMQEEIANLMADRENARREKNEAKDELNNLKAQFRLEKTDLENKLDEVLDRVAKIKNPEPESPVTEKVAEAPDAPDGQVVFVDFPNLVAYINIGRKSGVTVGQKFSVFRFGKRGVRTDKGEIEVKKVLEEMSIVAITQNLDNEYPIDIGDQVVNEVFDVTKTQYFTFAGRLVGRYSNEEVAKMIEELGWKVTPKTDVRTSYIIIGKEYESHPNYIDGLRYDIEILREVDILRILGKD